jgi:CRISPR-associated Csx11 family protein
MSNSLKILADTRDALLLAEIGCWIHMVGKFHKEFLEGAHDIDTHFVEKIKSSHKNLCDLLTGDTQPLIWTSTIWKNLNPLQVYDDTSIATLIKSHKNTRKTPARDGLEKLHADAHGRGSGIEKGILERFMTPQSSVCISTAFGFEKDYIDVSKIESERGTLYRALESYLDDLRRSNAHPPQGWKKFREQFIKTVTTYFVQSVGDTRHPINDVTLLDQTVSSVALFKASLAQTLLQGYNDPLQFRYHWRFLRIGINGPAFLSKSLKISDISARQNLIESALNEIRTLLEVEYPLGYEIYRDENGSIFVVPDVDDLLSYVTKGKESLHEALETIFQEHVKGEAIVSLKLTEKTRNMFLFGETVGCDIPEINIYSELVKKQWSEAPDQEICVVCGLRPQGPTQKSRARNVCSICEERHSDRSQRWAEKMNYTIWIDEICDMNGRIALIVGQFMLKEWLNGFLLNSILAFDPIKGQLTDKKRNGKQYDFDYGKLIKDISEALGSNQTLGNKFPLLDNLILKDQRGNLGRFRDIYDFYMVDSDLSSYSGEEWLFALLMLRQTPSPSRIRRIWETTRQFWQDILPPVEDMIDSEPRGITGIAGPRLLMKGDLTLESGLPVPYHAYEIVDESGTKISVVWDEKRQGFIIVENLAYISKLLRGKVPEINEKEKNDYQEYLNAWARSKMKNLKGRKKIEEPTGYGAKDIEWGFIDVKEVTEIPESEYVPAIPILAEPSTFMALVPADKAFELAKRIKAKYECEMGKVKNRLPLKIGIIFAHQYTPLRVILDAGQRMVREVPPPATWEVTNTVESTNPDLCKTFHLCIHNTVMWNIPLSMRDGQPDNWYPYVFLKDWGNNPHPETRNRSLKTLCPWDSQLTWLVHVKDIYPGDTIHFTPSVFDFEWLDTNSRRFEIAYEQGKRLGEKGTSRPYLLDHIEILENIWDTLRKTATNSQIHALRDTIEQKRREWNDERVFWQFCRDTLATLPWTAPPWGNDAEKWLNEWADYAVKGWLSDAIELYVQIMKEKVE